MLKFHIHLYLWQVLKHTLHTFKSLIPAVCKLINFLQGWYIITYALAIYHLNLFIAFLSPKVDPSVYDDDSDGKFLENLNV